MAVGNLIQSLSTTFSTACFSRVLHKGILAGHLVRDLPYYLGPDHFDRSTVCIDSPGDLARYL